MNLEIVGPRDPVLKEKLPPYTGRPQDLAEAARAMHGLMTRDHGIGIAANQVGLRHRFFLMAGADRVPFEQVYVCINPEILLGSALTDEAPEGCLTLPGQTFMVTRHRTVLVAYTNLNGVRKERDFGGRLGRCFQHERDHLDGKCIWQGGTS